MIDQLLRDAGIPEGVFHTVQGYASVGQALVHSSVEKIFFTGSTEVGGLVMEQAAPALKKVVLELGGNDPAIVCEDADLEMASSGIVWGRYNNCGQNCNAVERVYVHERIAEPFINLTMEKVKTLRIGPGMNPDTDVGPLASAAQKSKMEQLVQEAVGHGAKLVLGGHSTDDHEGYFFPPTILVWNRSSDHPRNEEIFGPVLNIIPVRDDDEAIRWANDTQYGLSASVWTKDPRRGRRIARRIEAGSVMVNDSVIAFGIHEFDWTGIKKSGVGWVHGEKGLDEMVNVQSVSINPMYRTQNFWWFPYSEQMARTMMSVMDFLFARNIIHRLRAVPRVLKAFTGYLIRNQNRSDKL
jgi:succinate-semialdehyde dehydrogenase/glutarate-semialdehyde dehydrogenase